MRDKYLSGIAKVSWYLVGIGTGLLIAGTLLMYQEKQMMQRDMQIMRAEKITLEQVHQQAQLGCKLENLELRARLGAKKMGVRR